MENQKMNGVISRALAIYFEAVEAGRYVYQINKKSMVIAELPHDWKDTPEEVKYVMENRMNMLEGRE